jgi:hypothetical protein
MTGIFKEYKNSNSENDILITEVSEAILTKYITEVIANKVRNIGKKIFERELAKYLLSSFNTSLLQSNY